MELNWFGDYLTLLSGSAGFLLKVDGFIRNAESRIFFRFRGKIPLSGIFFKTIIIVNIGTINMACQLFKLKYR